MQNLHCAAEATTEVWLWLRRGFSSSVDKSVPPQCKSWSHVKWPSFMQFRPSCIYRRRKSWWRLISTVKMIWTENVRLVDYILLCSRHTFMPFLAMICQFMQFLAIHTFHPNLFSCHQFYSLKTLMKAQSISVWKIFRKVFIWDVLWWDIYGHFQTLWE